MHVGGDRPSTCNLHLAELDSAAPDDCRVDWCRAPAMQKKADSTTSHGVTCGGAII